MAYLLVVPKQGFAKPLNWPELMRQFDFVPDSLWVGLGGWRGPGSKGGGSVRGLGTREKREREAGEIGQKIASLWNYSRTPLFRTRLIQSLCYFEVRPNSL